MELSDCEIFLNQWILNYVNSNPQAKHHLKAKYPLAEARISIKANPDRPGAFHAMRPWLQLEELSTSLRLVAEIPQQKQ